MYVFFYELVLLHTQLLNMRAKRKLFILKIKKTRLNRNKKYWSLMVLNLEKSSQCPNQKDFIKIIF